MERWLCAILAGLACSLWLTSVPQLFAIIVLLIGALSCFSLAFLVANQQPYWRHLHIVLKLVGFIVIGLAWGANYALSQQQQQTKLQPWYKQSVNVTAKIIEIPQLADGFWRLEVEFMTLNHQLLERAVKARLNWYEPVSATRPKAGQVWYFQLKLKAPQGVRNDGGFLYHRYLQAQSIAVLGTITSGKYLSGDANLRQHLWDHLHRATEGYAFAGLVQALTLGERQLLSTEQWQVLQRTGLAHLIAISGLHLTLIAGAALMLGQRLLAVLIRRRSQREQTNLWRLALLFAIVTSVFYAYLAGFATATLRALLMLLVVFAHRVLVTRIAPWRILLRAVMLVLAVDPLALLQAGFWLSVLAVASIIFMNWRWRPITGVFASIRMLWRLELLLTAALWPLTLALFGGVPLLAPVTNIIMIPLFTFWVLPLSLLTLLTHSQLSLTAFIAYLAMWPVQQVWPYLELLAVQSWQWLDVTESGRWYGVILILLVLAFPLRMWVRGGLVAAITMSMVLHTSLQSYDTSLRVYVLDVEQGNAIVLARQGRAWIIDSGMQWPHGTSMAERVLLPFLQHHQLTPEWALMSHTDLDHKGGVAALKASYPQLRWLGSGSGLPCARGQHGNWHGVQWQVLHPRQSYLNQHNNNSCVVLFSFGNVSILLPGDIERAAELDLLGQLAPVTAQILVLPHHGSNSSSETLFLQQVKPSVAIVSRGRNNPYQLPHPEVEKRLRALDVSWFDTATGGQVSVWTNGRQWRVEQPWHENSRPWFDRDN